MVLITEGAPVCCCPGAFSLKDRLGKTGVREETLGSNACRFAADTFDYGSELRGGSHDMVEGYSHRLLHAFRLSYGNIWRDGVKLALCLNAP